MSMLIEPAVLEILDCLPPRDLFQIGSAAASLRRLAALPHLWFRVYCSAFRGHLAAPPTFSELAAGAPTELAVDKFPWREMACHRAGLAISGPAAKILVGSGLRVEHAPSARAGMIDAEHPGRVTFFGSQQSAVLDRALRALPLVRPVAYAELFVHGGASIGLLRRDAHKANSHIGWVPGSLGYHGDEGSLWCGSSTRAGSLGFGPSFGLDPQVVVSNDNNHAPRHADVIGVGIDFAQEGEEAPSTAFFTKNGKFIGSVVLPSEDMVHFAFALHRPGDTASLNVGTCRFLFDVEAYSQEPKPAGAVDLGRPRRPSARGRQT